MRSLVRRSLVAVAVGSGVILAGFTGLANASAASSSNGGVDEGNDLRVGRTSL